jgi:predicted RNA-binding protein with PIN domain
MSLHYLIDGYNVLHALPELPLGAWEKKRDALLQLIAREKPHGKNRITVVFDSREGMGNQSRQGEIHVAYTSGETADDWISQYVRQTSNPRIVIVVTNDQGLRRLIRGTGAKSIGAEEFWRQAKPAAGPPPRELRAGMDSDSITEELKKKWLS